MSSSSLYCQFCKEIDTISEEKNILHKYYLVPNKMDSVYASQMVVFVCGVNYNLQHQNHL